MTGIIYMFYTGSEYGLAIGHRQVRDRIMLERGWGWGWGGVLVSVKKAYCLWYRSLGKIGTEGSWSNIHVLYW